MPLRSKSVVFPKKSEYVPVQKNFPEIFYLLGKIKGFMYLMYIAILYYMSDYYDNYENCEKYLLEHGYTRYKYNVLVIDVLFSVMYLKDSDHMEINLFYGKSGEWCIMTCSDNYSGKMGPQFWERIASTYESHVLEHFKFHVDNEDFLRLVGDNDYNTVEMVFRRHEMEKS